jgi:hypothetical protein
MRKNLHKERRREETRRKEKGIRKTKMMMQGGKSEVAVQQQWEANLVQEQAKVDAIPHKQDPLENNQVEPISPQEQASMRPTPLRDLAQVGQVQIGSTQTLGLA